MTHTESKTRLAENPELRQVLQDLLTTQNFGVLCTQSHGQPHGSVMCFAVADDLSRIWFATPRNTRKFENMQANDRVAFVVDNTSNRPSDVFEAVAVTTTGRVRELQGSARDAALERYLERHPNLGQFVTAPSSALVELAVVTYQIVRQFQQTVQIEIG